MSYLKMQTIKTSDDAFGAENREILLFCNCLMVNVLCFESFLLYLCSVPLAVFGYVIRSLLQYQMLLLVI